MQPARKIILLVGVLVAFLLGALVLITVALISKKQPVAPTAPTKEQAAEITLNTPKTYSNCPTTATSDVVTTSGVGDRQIKGEISVQFIVSAGNRVVWKIYDIDQTGDLNLTIEYPPIWDWILNSQGQGEIHVNPTLVIYENGQKTITLGPGQDWDIFCLNIPSRPTATPSAGVQPQVSPSPTVVPTPTIATTIIPTPTATPGTGGFASSPTASPVSTPTPTTTPSVTPGTGGANVETSTPTPVVASSPSYSPASPNIYPVIPTSGTITPTILLLFAGAILLFLGLFKFA